MAQSKDVLSLDSTFFSSQTTSGSRQQEQLSYNKVVVENNQGSSGNNKLAAKGPIIEPLWLENCFDSRQQSRTMVDCFSLESSYIPTMCYVYACLGCSTRLNRESIPLKIDRDPMNLNFEAKKMLMNQTLS